MTTRLTTFTNDGLTFDVLDDGPLDGVPVVLLHGFPQTATEWSRVAPHLHDRGYRTIAPNQRGYSPGARPRGRAAYRMSALVGDTVALIRAIGDEPVHLVGHDWGSAVAWTTAAQHPELVRTLTSVSVPHPMAFTRSLVRSNQALHSFYMAVFQIPWLPEVLLQQAFRSVNTPERHRRAESLSQMDAEQFDQVRGGVIDSGALTYALNWYRAMLIMGPRTVTRKVSAPTTHVWGTRDVGLTRKGAELTADYATGPYKLEILDASHWIPDERPAELAAIIAERASNAM
ncbi:alpha/beta fold hydrolase [Antrihabitans cavernicola]|uniref:Alpha/beta fold hydrolase n=1 Tax=Antrihabitans cavernicola TaxID=2495913 RepID=A0A5A7S791_9NOCA|nr:alpha/beta fold hydrolase [Spelaeibacter cavernicola]KAA0018516.1 alpha/beta fold hydrolase [Spelaeibacter cavernicola]